MNSRLTDRRSRLACLTEASRFRIVAELAQARGLSVSELASVVSLSQSCTTRHLQALERQGLVRRNRRGKRVCFEIVSGVPEIEILLNWLEAEGDANSLRPLPAGSAADPEGAEVATRESRPGARVSAAGAGKHVRAVVRRPARTRASSARAKLRVAAKATLVENAPLDLAEAPADQPSAEPHSSPDGSPDEESPMIPRAARSEIEVFLL
jgi:DNA-binding transcriptional ArsR family regulator